jgi:hypothetical protein
MLLHHNFKMLAEAGCKHIQMSRYLRWRMTLKRRREPSRNDR